MKTIRLIPVFSLALSCLATFGLPSLAGACGEPNEIKLTRLAKEAISAQPQIAASAIAALRVEGPEGLDALFRVHEAVIRAHTDSTLPENEEWTLLKTALDQVGAQRDCYSSHLYWFTDFERAQVAAKASGKPILSLRLLGKLDEELSCANSRFFRTTLYANTQVSAYLREHFILHWKSVRPVPKVTIDFGDGRKLERTITGNSIHYVLDSDGKIIDALPGVYGPTAFARSLAAAEILFNSLKGKAEGERRFLLAQYYGSLNNKISVAWLADITKLGGKKPEGVAVQVNEKGEALTIMPLAVSK